MFAAAFPMLAISCGNETASFATYDGYCVVPADADNKADVKWANYLYEHWARRASETVQVVNGKEGGKKNLLRVSVGIDKDMSSDYAVKKSSDEIALFARDAEKMMWLVYQFMESTGEADSRMDIDDLPPAVISCSDDTSGTFAFEYRGIYSPTGCDEDKMHILGSHNPDYDWGLWGHNLPKLFHGKIPADAQAMFAGKRTDEQFCFSSPTLYATVKNFILSEYGNGDESGEIRFAIFPNDNDIVCRCAKCVAAGNTASSATPAVTAFIERLAREFPKHLFFTSAYSTTSKPASRTLPANTGVIVSALDVPLRERGLWRKEEKGFDQKIAEWQKVTKRIYVWDYMSNFDDYLTPYPCIGLLHERLLHYKEIGVSGVFFNGSGYDYATFDDVQTYALSQLLINPELSAKSLVEKAFRRLYPRTGEVLANFYDSIEEKAQSKTNKKELLPYAGISDATRSYLDAQTFEKFCIELDQLSKGCESNERQLVSPLLTALNFPRLELMRAGLTDYDGNVKGECLAALQGHKQISNMANYRESCGSLDSYISEWFSNPPLMDTEVDFLAGIALDPLTPVDDGKETTKLLTDGLHGFASDYHTGWMQVSSPTLKLKIPADAVRKGALQLQLGFLHSQRWHIALPHTLEVWQGDKLLCKAELTENTGNATPFERVSVECDVEDAEPSVPLELHLFRDKANGRSMALDEIELYAH